MVSASELLGDSHLIYECEGMGSGKFFPTYGLVTYSQIRSGDLEIP